MATAAAKYETLVLHIEKPAAESVGSQAKVSWKLKLPLISTNVGILKTITAQTRRVSYGLNDPDGPALCIANATSELALVPCPDTLVRVPRLIWLGQEWQWSCHECPQLVPISLSTVCDS